MKVAGEHTYNTCCGLLLTIIAVGLLGVFISLACLTLINYDATNFQTKTTSNSITINEVFGYEKTHFALAVGLIDQYKRASKMPSNEEI